FAALARAAAGRTCAAAVHLHQSLYQQQPDAQAGVRTLPRTWRPGEWVEEVGQDLWGNPSARVPYTQDGFVPLAPGRQPESPPRLGVLGRIFQQVAHNLFQSGWVCFQWEGRGRQRQGEFVPPGVDQGAHGFDGSGEDLGQVNGLLLEGELAAADA